MFFHVNCSRCYHMHKHVQLRVHKNPKMFMRFNCHKCHHKIAGIGRNETQSSFGSTETQPPGAGYGRPSRPSNLQSCINVDHPSGQPSGVEKAGSTVHSSPSWSKRAEPDLSPHQDLHTDDTGARPQASVRNDYSLREASGPATKSLSTIRSRLILKLGQSKVHLLEKSKNMKLFVSRFWKRNTPSPPGDVQMEVDPVPSDVQSDIRDFQHRPREGDRSVQPQDDHPSTPPPEFQRRPSSVEEQLQATARKNERLRQRRREATLRRDVLSGRFCHCEANCACVRRDSVITDAGTDSPSTSRRPTLQQTEDAIADLPPGLLRFIHEPHQFNNPREPLDNSLLDRLAENGTRPHVRLSQATTIGSAAEA